MKKTLTLFAFLLVAGTTFAQSPAEKLIKLSNSEDMYTAGIKQIISAGKMQFGEISPGYWEKAEKDAFKSISEDLTPQMIDIYNKHYTEEDIKALIKFYESPVGKKVLEKTPLILQESMIIGQQWGMNLMQKFQKDADKKNPYKVKKGE